MQFVAAGVERSGQRDPHLEGLSPAHDEVFVLVQVCVVLGAVLP